MLPWSQFLYAEGGADEIRLAFSTHDVVVSGGQLGPLLADLSAQRVSVLREPLRAGVFLPEAVSRLTSISVKKLE